MRKKNVKRKIPAVRENQNDRFRVVYRDKHSFTILRVEILREATGELLVYEFNADDLTENDSIHFSTAVVDGNFIVIWDSFIEDKARLI